MKKNVLKRIVCVFLALAIAAAAFTAGFFTHKLTRDSRVNSYEWALEYIEKYYYYGIAGDSFTYETINAMLDSYSAFYTAEEYQALQASNAGSKTGLGFTYSYLDGTGVFIHSVIGNSPAYISGLRAGEQLVSGSVAEGETVKFSSSSAFSEFVSSAADGEEMTLTSSDGQTYTMAKASYTASYAMMSTNDSAWIFTGEGELELTEAESERLSYLPDGAAYLRLSQFYGGAADEFYELVEKFNALHCTTLILDLRSNGGGYVSVMQKIAGVFAGGESKVAMVARDRDGNEEKAYCKKVTDSSQRISSDVKIYVLANAGTASASEALLGAMICYGVLDHENIFLSDYSEEYLAWVQSGGQEAKTARTYGKGIMQSTYVNSLTGEAIKLTVAQIYWPDGVTCIHGVGLTSADGCSTVYADWVMTKGDEELQSVVKVVCSGT